jgi:glycine/D-amino acid oxidase-like deaminating enzyme
MASALAAQGRKSRIAVIGAGALGGWTAPYLLRMGARVTLVDAWGPGHSRASSGGETRIIRATYGPDRIYVQLVVRALALWREHEHRLT